MCKQKQEGCVCVRLSQHNGCTYQNALLRPSHILHGQHLRVIVSVYVCGHVSLQVQMHFSVAAFHCAQRDLIQHYVPFTSALSGMAWFLLVLTHSIPWFTSRQTHRQLSYQVQHGCSLYLGTCSTIQI